MKIAIVFDGLGIGGIEIIGKNFAEIFNDNNFEVTVFNLDPKQNIMENEFPKNIKIVHLPFGRKICPEQYAQIIKHFWFGRFLYPIMYIILTMFCLIYKYFCKLIYKELSSEYDLAIAISGHFNDLTFIAFDFLKTKNKVAWSHGALYSYLLMSDGFFNLYKKINNIIVSVDDSEEEVIMYNKVSFNTSKIYNPVSFSEKYLDNNKIEKLKKKFGKYILVIARFTYPHKDHYTILSAFNLLIEKYEHDLNIVLIGDGPEYDNIIRHVSNFNEKVRSNIHFLGNQKDIINYYKSAYLLVHASVAGEGLPTVMIEALHYELPMVVTDSKVGPREILGDNEYGLLCKVKDYEDMAKKINSLYLNKDLYEEIKEKSKIRARDFYPEKIFEKFMNYINNL